MGWGWDWGRVRDASHCSLEELGRGKGIAVQRGGVYLLERGKVGGVRGLDKGGIGVVGEGSVMTNSRFPGPLTIGKSGRRGVGAVCCW